MTVRIHHVPATRLEPPESTIVDAEFETLVSLRAGTLRKAGIFERVTPSGDEYRDMPDDDLVEDLLAQVEHDGDCWLVTEIDREANAKVPKEWQAALGDEANRHGALDDYAYEHESEPGDDL